jgi:N-acetylmuramoyl-L-alanine amidase
MHIAQHRLVGATVRHVPSPNCGGLLNKARYLVVHFTAGRDAQSSVNWLANPQSKASAHVVVARDGTTTQLVPFDRVAWHAGVSAWNGIDGLNEHSVGIELDNMGELTRAGSLYVAWFKTQVLPEEVVAAPHPFDGVPSLWHDFTEAQIESAIELASLLCDAYQIKDILGHDDIAGPAFPMRSFKARVLGRQVVARVRYRVAADFLNIRTGPGLDFPFAAAPLVQGTGVLLDVQQAQWSRVTVEFQPSSQGWVSNAYITPA